MPATDLADKPLPAPARPGCDQNGIELHRAGLLAILSKLDAIGYDFVAPTPATQARVLSRRHPPIARDLPDLLGWSLPAGPGTIAAELKADLLDAGVLAPSDDHALRPCLRASRVDDCLFWHSAYPTDAHDAVFLGPDSHRFAQFAAANMPAHCRTILDYGAGAGVGGIIAARRAAGARLVIADINPKALFLASINAEHAGVAHDTIRASRIAEIDAAFDLVVMHPPFMIDGGRRAYRDGGGLHGAQLSLDWTLAGAERLAPGGRLIMHTGAAIVGGCDVLRAALGEHFPRAGFAFEFRELDTDIFGDELEKPAYCEVDRIAAVGVIIERETV